MHEDAIESAKMPVPWTGKDLILVGIAIACLLLILNGVLVVQSDAFVEKISSHQALFTFGLLLTQELVFLGPLYYFVLRPHRWSLALLGFRRVNVWKSIVTVLKAFSMFFSVSFLLAFLMASFAIELPGFTQQAEHLPLFGETPEDIFLAVIALIGIAPIVEEVMFRGFLLQTLLHSKKTWVATSITAAIFSMAHFEFQSIGMILILALILNWIFIRTRSIVPCIAFHMLNNALALGVELWLR